MKTKQKKRGTHTHSGCIKVKKSGGSDGGDDDDGNSIIFSMYKYVDKEFSGSVSGNITSSLHPITHLESLKRLIERATHSQIHIHTKIHLYYTPL